MMNESDPVGKPVYSPNLFWSQYLPPANQQVVHFEVSLTPPITWRFGLEVAQVRLGDANVALLDRLSPDQSSWF